mmetsp:Transcript_26143/g.39566  ORF Transcript_26143/g.39566 Transcript_26143/m.39566 type:complete len:516 (+) Transcript_26143:93-1640(+)
MVNVSAMASALAATLVAVISIVTVYVRNETIVMNITPSLNEKKESANTNAASTTVTTTTSSSKCHPLRQNLCSQCELDVAAAAYEYFIRGRGIFESAGGAGRVVFDDASKLKLQQAKAIFEESLLIDSTTPFASSTYQNLGLVLSKLGDTKGSYDALEKAVQLDDENVYAHHSFAKALSTTHREEDWHLADKHFSKAHQLLSNANEKEINFNLVLLILSSHGIVFDRIATRGRDVNNKNNSNLSPDNRTNYLIKARQKFEDVIDLVKSGKVSPKSAMNSINYLQGILRELDAENGESKRDELLEWAIQQGLWRDKRQTPRVFNHMLYDAIKPKPIRPWIPNPEQVFPALKSAMNQWHTILEEYRAARINGLQPVGERVDQDVILYNKALGEDWSEFPILSNGMELTPDIAPTVTEIFRRVIPPMGTAAFSSITPGTKIKPHCGPSNELITCHLGIIIPSHGSVNELGMAAGGEKRTWREGEWICFEDSMEHEVWNNSKQTRVVLIVQMWHPYLNI